MTESPGERLIPLSEAAKLAGVTPEHLNLLARKERLRAQKIGRNWFTTKKWLDDYFNADHIKQDDGFDLLSLRQLEKEERVELAKIQAEVELRRIEKEERLALSRGDGSNTLPQPSEHAHSGAPALELLNLLAQEIKKLRAEMREEQGEKQALLFAFEHLQNQVGEDIEHRVADLHYQLNEKFVNLILQTEAMGQSQSAQLDLLGDQDQKNLFDFLAEQMNLLKEQVRELSFDLTRKMERIVQKQKHADQIKKNKEQELESNGESQNRRPDYAPAEFDEALVYMEHSLQAEEEASVINEWMEKNLKMLMDENHRASSASPGEIGVLAFGEAERGLGQVEFRTVFVAESGLDGRHLFDMSEPRGAWRTRPLHADGIHYLSSAPEVFHKIEPSPYFHSAGPSRVYSMSRPYASFALGALLLLFSFGLSHADSPLVRSGHKALSVFGTSETFPAVLGLKLGESLAGEVSGILHGLEVLAKSASPASDGRADLAKHRAQELGNHILGVRIATTEALGAVVSGASGIGTREWVFARMGRELPWYIYNAVELTPDDILAALNTFSPRGTWYDPTFYDWTRVSSRIARGGESAGFVFVKASQPLALAKNALRANLSREFTSPENGPVNVLEQGVGMFAGRVLVSLDVAKRSYANTGRVATGALLNRFGQETGGQVAGARAGIGPAENQDAVSLWPGFKQSVRRLKMETREFIQRFSVYGK
jgi:hypothetical protein